MKLRLFTLLAGTLLNTLVQAQSPCQTADNLVGNCGFDTNTAGWTPSNGFVSHDPKDGNDQAWCPANASVLRRIPRDALAVHDGC